jgi:hypothetical protein
MPRINRLLKAVIGLGLIAAMSGCVVSESAHFQTQLSATVQSDEFADIDVAVAFGLQRGQPHVAVTAIRDH